MLVFAERMSMHQGFFQMREEREEAKRKKKCKDGMRASEESNTTSPYLTTLPYITPLTRKEMLKGSVCIWLPMAIRQSESDSFSALSIVLASLFSMDTKR